MLADNTVMGWRVDTAPIQTMTREDFAPRIAATKKVQSPSSHATIRKNELSKAGKNPWEVWIVFCRETGSRLMRESKCGSCGTWLVALSAGGVALGAARGVAVQRDRFHRTAELTRSTGLDTRVRKEGKCIATAGLVRFGLVFVKAERGKVEKMS